MLQPSKLRQRYHVFLSLFVCGILLLNFFISGITTQAATNTVDVRVIASSDDAEQYSATSSSSPGYMYLTSSDLELVNDGSKNQEVGTRFQDIQIPQGSTITSAYIQFTVDEKDSVATSLAIHGEATDNAPTFTSTK